jgi:peptide-methionine (S)-S-oxide reductase
MLFRRFSISLFIMLSIVGVVIYGGFRSMFANPLAAFNGNATQITSKLATKQLDPPIDLRVTKATGLQTAVLAGGCFWGVEAVFEQLQGVSKVVSGFSGGSKDTANYETVSGGESGHAEAVQITYDPQQISYGQLLKVFLTIAHDPTQLNRQDPDTGTQYRSAIFVANDEQKRVAQAYIDRVDRLQIFPAPIVTQIVPIDRFYAAEAYHQDFISRNPTYPYVVINDLPKLERLRTEFPQLIKSSRS